MAKSPRITVLQPDHDVTLGAFENWLISAGCRLSIVELWHHDVPNITVCGDGILMLGGHESTHNTDAYPWLNSVKDLLADAHSIGIPILGICLGHQTLAEALGGEVTESHPNGMEKLPTEITWLPGASTDPIFGDVAKSSDTSWYYESHSDVVTKLPETAVELAYSQSYRNQAFRLENSWGVQFHPEATQAQAISWAEKENCSNSEIAKISEVADAVAAAAKPLAYAFAAYVTANRG